MNFSEFNNLETVPIDNHIKLENSINGMNNPNGNNTNGNNTNGNNTNGNNPNGNNTNGNNTNGMNNPNGNNPNGNNPNGMNNPNGNNPNGNNSINIPTHRPMYPPIIPTINMESVTKDYDNSSSNETNPNPNKIKLVHLGIIITLSFFTSIAWNEAIRYYIGRSIKFYNGHPMYYIYYASVSTFITFMYYLYIFLK